jgi:hypothetical protein
MTQGRTPRLPPPDRFTLYVCRQCGAWDLSPEEITHNSKRCEGRTDLGHIDRVTAETVEREPCR